MTMNTASAVTPVAANPAASRYWKVWTGRIVSALPVLVMVVSAAIKLSHSSWFVDVWVGRMGLPEGTMTGLGLVEIACAVLYLVPRTSVLGAILVTGYLGGAVMTHLRVGDGLASLDPIFFGVAAWAGLFLRDERLQKLLPFTKTK